MDENCVFLSKTKFKSKVANKDRMYCQIYLVGCVAKHQARRELDNVNFKVYVEEWKNNNYKYKKSIWLRILENSDKKLAHESCQDTFFKCSYLNSYTYYSERKWSLINT